VQLQQLQRLRFLELMTGEERSTSAGAADFAHCPARETGLEANAELSSPWAGAPASAYDLYAVASSSCPHQLHNALVKTAFIQTALMMLLVQCGSSSRHCTDHHASDFCVTVVDLAQLCLHAEPLRMVSQTCHIVSSSIFPRCR